VTWDDIEGKFRDLGQNGSSEVFLLVGSMINLYTSLEGCLLEQLNNTISTSPLTLHPRGTFNLDESVFIRTKRAANGEWEVIGPTRTSNSRLTQISFSVELAPADAISRGQNLLISLSPPHHACDKGRESRFRGDLGSVRRSLTW